MANLYVPLLGHTNLIDRIPYPRTILTTINHYFVLMKIKFCDYFVPYENARTVISTAILRFRAIYYKTHTKIKQVLIPVPARNTQILTSYSMSIV